MNVHSDKRHINLGSGEDLSIEEPVSAVKRVVGFEGQLVKDAPELVGTSRTLMSIAGPQSIAWQQKITLRNRLQGAKRVSCAASCD